MLLFLNCIGKKQTEEIRVLNENDCDSDFNIFFEKFQKDSAFQIRHVKFPYMYYYSDEDFPLDMMESAVWKEDFETIDFKSDTNSQFTINFINKIDSVSCIKQNKSKSIIEYKFVIINHCWFLVEVIDNTD